MGVRKLMPVLPFIFANGGGGSKETHRLYIWIIVVLSSLEPPKGADINVAPQKVIIKVCFYTLVK